MKLIKSFSYYSVTSIIQQGIPFLLLPVFTTYLSPTDYGILASLSILLSFVLPFILLSSNGAINVEYVRDDFKDFARYFSSAFFTICLAFVINLLIFFLAGPLIARTFSLPLVWVLLIPVIAFFNSIITVKLSLDQIQKKVISFCTVSIVNSGLNLIIALLLVIYWHYSYEGRMVGMLVAYFLVGSFCLFSFYKKGLFTTHISKKFQLDALKFGIPLIPHAIGHIVINASDRFFIAKYVNLEELGIYHVGYSLGLIIFVLAGSFNNAWTPILQFKLKEGSREAHLEILLVSLLFVLGLGICTILLYFFSPLIFYIFIGDEFQSAIIYVGWVALSYVFLGIYLVAANFLFYLKRTKVFIGLAAMNITINIALNYLLIIKFGTIGAAYATVISFCIFAIVTSIISHKISPMPWRALPSYAVQQIQNFRK